jgi:hypothetical protein
MCYLCSCLTQKKSAVYCPLACLVKFHLALHSQLRWVVPIDRNPTYSCSMATRHPLWATQFEVLQSHCRREAKDPNRNILYSVF